MTARTAAGGWQSAGVADTRILFVSHLPGSGIARGALHGRFGDDIEVVDFAEVTAELLASFDPHFVVSPIHTAGFDVVDLGLRLWQLRYGGSYRVLSEAPLPNPGLVLREVRTHCPGLDVDILNMALLRS